MKWLFKILFLLLLLNVKSQQIVMFSHYFQQPMLYNPSATGTKGATNLMLINHTQWTGFKGGPQYNILTLDGNLKNKNTGIGLSLISDKKGITSRLAGNLFYSYKLKFTKDIHLLLGVSAGAVNQSINLSSATVENQNDPYLFSNTQQTTTFDANTGFTFNAKDFSLGFAVPQIAGNKLGYTSDTNSRTFYTHARHYMTTAKYKIMLSKKKNISVSPLALVRYVPGAPMQYDANLNFDFKNIFWLGATYKSNYAVGANLGVTLFKRLSIGYSYDFMIGKINKYGGLSHEIMLSYKFIKKVKTDTLTEQEKELLAEMKEKDLNKLILQNLLRKIEAVLDKGNPTQQEINELMEEISAFFDGTDPSEEEMQKIVKKYYKAVKQPGELSVLIKGKVTYSDKPDASDFSDIIINVVDLGTEEIVATCHPTTKAGKYFMILKPGRKYRITAECPGYQKTVRSFSPDGSVESYEMSQEIILKK